MYFFMVSQDEGVTHVHLISSTHDKIIFSWWQNAGRAAQIHSVSMNEQQHSLKNQTAWIEGEDVLRWRAYVVQSERLMQEML